MLRHYIKIAFRNLWKYKTQSLISIVGLAVGFTCFALSSLWLRNESSYDNFYKDTDRIYLVRKGEKNVIDSYREGVDRNLVPGAFPDYLRGNYPEIEQLTHFSYYPKSNRMDVKYNNHLFRLITIYVDNSFIDLFSITLLQGNLSFLNTPGNQIAISEKMAKKIFEKESALDKTVIISDREYVIAAITKDQEGPSNFSFDILMAKNRSTDSNWGISLDVCFVKLFRNTDIVSLAKKLEEIEVAQTYGEHILNRTFSFELVPIENVRSAYPFEEPQVEQNHIRLFAFSGVILIVCVLLNFFTLFFSRFRIRRKEFAIRFVNGSSLGSLFELLLSEFLLILLFALFLGTVFIRILLPYFRQLSQVQISLSEIYGESVLYLVVIILLAILIFFLCLLDFRRRSLSTAVRKFNNHILRKASVALQLIISIGFIYCTIIMQQQLRHLHSTDIGFSYKNIGQLTMDPYPDFQEWKSSMLQIPGIKKVVVGNPPLMPASYISTTSFNDGDGTKWQLESFFISEDFFDIYDLKLLEGEFLTDSDPDNYIVITETVARMLGLENAVGEKIGSILHIKGVVRDIHNSLPTLPPKPIFFQLQKGTFSNRRQPNIAIFSYEDGSWEVVKKNIQYWHKKSYSDQEGYTLTSSEETYNEYFTSEQALLKLLAFVSLVCIIVSVFGFISLVSLTCEERRKEMAIRKVNGASLSDILDIFFKEYFLLLLLGALIAFPSGYFIMKRWIEQYTIQMTISPSIYIIILLLLALLIVLCVGWKVVKTAKENPAKVLKSE